MASDPIYDGATAAFAQVQATVAQLRTEYDSVCQQILDVQAQLKTAPLSYITFEDMKAGILDFIDASGTRYGADKVKNRISAFGRNYLNSSTVFTEVAGKPLRYIDIEGAVTGQSAILGWAQLLTPEKNQFNDQVLYYLFSPIIKTVVAALMETMEPEDFGYNKIDPALIAGDRATIRANIADLNSQLASLQTQRSDLASKLASLGVAVPLWK